MAFDLKAAAAAVRQEQTDADNAEKERKDRIQGLEDAVFDFMAERSKPVEISTSGNELNIKHGSGAVISIFAVDNELYSIDLGGFSPSNLAPPSGEFNNPMDKDSMLKCLIRWYQRLP